MAEIPADYHIVQLRDENRTAFEDNPRKFRRVRIIIHSSNVWPTSRISENHVTVYLLIDDSSRAVRLDMRTDPPDIRGMLVWSKHTSQTSRSELAHRTYQLSSSIEVRHLYQAVRDDWGLHRYEFSGGGSGCRYWVLTLLSRMASRHWLNDGQVLNAAEFLQYQYTRGMEPWTIEIKEGTFLTPQEWVESWTPGDDDDDGEEVGDDVGAEDGAVEVTEAEDVEEDEATPTQDPNAPYWDGQYYTTQAHPQLVWMNGAWVARPH